VVRQQSWGRGTEKCEEFVNVINKRSKIREIPVPWRFPNCPSP
jgi:hypothetical protein